jgi:hypothetical protein
MLKTMPIVTHTMPIVKIYDTLVQPARLVGPGGLRRAYPFSCTAAVLRSAGRLHCGRAVACAHGPPWPYMQPTCGVSISGPPIRARESEQSAVDHRRPSPAAPLTGRFRRATVLPSAADYI